MLKLFYYISLFLILTSGLSGALNLTIHDFTASTFSFSLNGQLSGSTPTKFENQLYFKPDPTGWVTAGTLSQATPSNAITGVSSDWRNSGGGGGYFILIFSRDLTTSDTGSGTMLTYDAGSNVFNPGYVGDIELSWGDQTVQDVVAVPEPRYYAIALVFLSLVLGLIRRNRMNRLRKRL